MKRYILLWHKSKYQGPVLFDLKEKCLYFFTPTLKKFKKEGTILKHLKMGGRWGYTKKGEIGADFIGEGDSIESCFEDIKNQRVIDAL